MKKAAFFTLFFFFFSVVQPPQARAVVLIDDAMIGAVLLTGIAVAGVHGAATYYEKTGENPVTALVNGVNYIFQPAILAFQENFVTPETFPSAAAQYVGVEASVGASIANLADFVSSAAIGTYSAIKNIIDQFTTDGTYPEDGLVTNNVFPLSDGSNVKVGNYQGYTGMAPGYLESLTAPKFFYGVDKRCVFNGSQLLCGPNGKYNSGWMDRIDMYGASITSVAPTYPEPTGDRDLPSIGAAIASSADPNVKNEFHDALRNMPPGQVVTTGKVAPSAELDDAPPPAVSSNDVQKFYAQNAVDVANKAVEVVNDPAATPADIASAQTAAQAASQAAENAVTQAEASPETFGDVPLSGFAEPYNPGPFDIPDRFDAFLANVAGTGLFSLPSQYFNSLPGGGSPVYTVEAGSYGSHTIDLGETMGTGLAVLKTVLLLCFAFLSVRVVVLKR